MGGLRRGWGWVLGAMVLVSGPLAQAATQTRLLIVPHQASAALPAVTALAEGLAQPLAQTTVVLAPAPYQQAALAAHLGARAATNSAYAVSLGAKVGASHVLYLRAQSETLPATAKRRRARERLTLAAVLVDTTTGESLLSRRYVATARGLGADALRNHVADDVKKALAQQGAPQGVAQGVAPSTPTDAVAAADAQPAPQQAPVAPAAPVPAPTAASHVPQAVAVAPQPETMPPSTPQLDGVRLDRMAFGVRAQLGLLLYSRQATLSTLGVTQLQYGVGIRGPAPVFSRGTLQAEFFPVHMARRHRSPRVVDGLGLHVAGNLGWPATRLAAGGTRKSKAGTLRGGLTFRYLVGQSAKAPEVAARLGVSRYGFAMPKSTVFPALSYTALYLDVSTEVPLGTPKVALVAEAALLPAMTLGADAKSLGVARGSRLGAWAEAGLRYSPIAHLDILAMFDWEHYGAKFVGSTLLPNTSRQYASVTLKETIMGGRLAIGTTF